MYTCLCLQTALCAFIGMAFSTIYLEWLFRDVDNVKGTDKVPMMEARQVGATRKEHFGRCIPKEASAQCSAGPYSCQPLCCCS